MSHLFAAKMVASERSDQSDAILCFGQDIVRLSLKDTLTQHNRKRKWM
jgi:hypothetical protein